MNVTIRSACVLLVAAVSMAACAGASSGEAADPHRLFGAATPLSEVVGTEIVTSHVVPMTCIPTRVDPVGVFISLEIDEWAIAGDAVEISVRPNYTKLGSHPSGCADPSIVFEDSLFLIGPDDETVHAASTAVDGDVTTVEFDLDGRSVDEWSAVVLPTIGYSLGNGDRQTSIFGFVGHYELG